MQVHAYTCLPRLLHISLVYLVCCTYLVFAWLVYFPMAIATYSLLCIVYYNWYGCFVLSLPMSLSAIISYSCMPCLLYIPIKSAMPKYHSKFPIALYAHLVSFSNIKSILSNRTYTTEFAVSSHERFNIIRQHCGFIWRQKAPFRSIQTIE